VGRAVPGRAAGAAVGAVAALGRVAVRLRVPVAGAALPRRRALARVTEVRPAVLPSARLLRLLLALPPGLLALPLGLLPGVAGGEPGVLRRGRRPWHRAGNLVAAARSGRVVPGGVTAVWLGRLPRRLSGRQRPRTAGGQHGWAGRPTGASGVPGRI
jgi:hypothetical protein